MHLLEKGARVNANVQERVTRINTPLMMATLQGHRNVVRQLLRAGADAGVRVTGGIRTDGNVFRGSLYGDFWNWGDIGNGYGSGVASLNLNHNRYTIVFQAGAAAGTPASILGTDVEIPGVATMTFLRTALNAQRKARGEAELSAGDFLKVVRDKARTLKIDADMLKRPVNVGFAHPISPKHQSRMDFWA